LAFREVSLSISAEEKMRSQLPRIPLPRNSDWALLFFSALIVVSGCGETASKQSDLDSSPKLESDPQMLTMKSKCREDGDKVRAEWARTYFSEQFSKEPEYAYSPSLKTCIWVGEYWGKSALLPGEMHVRFLLDVYSNKTLIEYTANDGKPIGEISAMDFERKRMEILGLDKPDEPESELKRQLKYRQ
jgi:hypothetical protein